MQPSEPPADPHRPPSAVPGLPGYPPAGAVPPGGPVAGPRRPTTVTLAGIGDLVAALPLLLTAAMLALLVLAAMVVCGVLTLRGRPAGRIGTYLLGCLFGLVGVLGCLGAVVRSFVVLAPVNIVGGFAAALLIVATVGPVVLLSLPSSRGYFDARRGPTAAPPPAAPPR